MAFLETFPLFGRSKKPLVGLDISSTSVKLIELSRSGDRYRVESYGIESLPQNSVVEKNITDVSSVAEAIRRVVQRSGTKAREAAVAVSGSSVITKMIELPANLTEDEMELQIEMGADQYIPYPIEEVSLDFEIDTTTEREDDNVNVLLAASRKENVELRVDVIELGGLVPRVVDIEMYAMERAFHLVEKENPNLSGNKTVAIVDLGSTMTTLNVLHESKTVYTREQVFGGKQLTEEIQRRYGLSYEEASIAKRQGGLPDDYEPEVLEPFKELMVQQMSRSLQFFFSSSRFNQIDYIALTGGSALIPGAVEMVSERLGISAGIVNPFAGMSLASRVNAQSLSEDAPSLMIACGLALRSFD